MTKLMFCGDCGDLVAPPRADMKPVWCHCRRHAFWWRDGVRGLLSVHDTQFPERNGGDGGKAWVIGLHNGVLTHRGVTASHYPASHYNMVTTKNAVEEILAATPDSYIFKRAGSLVIRISPGESGDTKWEAQVPA